MLKSTLVRILAKKTQLPQMVVQEGLKELIQFMVDSLSRGEPIEIRGFGRFFIRQHPWRLARNPQTGETMLLENHCVLRFKPSQFLLKRLNRSLSKLPILDSGKAQFERVPEFTWGNEDANENCNTASIQNRQFRKRSNDE